MRTKFLRLVARSIQALALSLAFAATSVLSSAAATEPTPSGRYDCPALAPNWERSFEEKCVHDPNSPWQPFCRAADRYVHDKTKKYPGLISSQDDTVNVDFWRDMQQAGRDTPYCKALVDSQEVFERKLLACGDNESCIVPVLYARVQELSRIEKRYTGPTLDGKAIAAFLGRDAKLRVDARESLQERLLRGLSISPLPRAAIPGQKLNFTWGFEPHNAQVQSLVISDNQGQVLALGLVDNLYLQGADGKKLPADALIRLFVRSPAVLPELQAPLRSWAAADALGMNAQCSGPRALPCQKALGDFPKLLVYRLPCPSGKLEACRLTLPPASAAPIPSVEIFHQ